MLLESLNSVKIANFLLFLTKFYWKKGKLGRKVKVRLGLNVDISNTE